MNTNWQFLIKRIQSESHYRNGKTMNAISVISVDVVMHNGSPVVWEITNSSKVEPTYSLAETIGKFSHHIQRLFRLCSSPDNASEVLGNLVDDLEKQLTYSK